MMTPWQKQLRSLPTETIQHCILCDAVVGEPDHQWCSYLELVAPFNVMRCPRCNLRWLSPRPNVHGYRELYSNQMYFGGVGPSPADYSKLVERRIGFLRSRIRKAACLSDSHSALSILDYGAATGEFVRVAQEEGHRCVGLELSADARATAKSRNNVSLLSPDEMDTIHGKQFDVIHMNHVLEHMPNPLSHLRWCASVLRAQGVLVLEVPQQFDNDLDRLRRALHMGGKRPHFDAYSLHHTYFFTPNTMTSILNRADFKVSSLTTFNSDKTPFWPPSLKNWVLRPFLRFADTLHHGGNIIEVFARLA